MSLSVKGFAVERYSDLSPLTIEERIDIAKSAFDFFCPINHRKYREQLSLPAEAPPSLGVFFGWYKETKKVDLHKRLFRVIEFIGLLTSSRLLHSAGTGRGAPPFNECYISMLELSSVESKGSLFLGKYIGFDLIANAIKFNLAFITGITPCGDIHFGSGVLINSCVVLTCGHILNDMVVDDCLEIYGKKYKIKIKESHPIIDFGVIILDEPVAEAAHCKDIALRDAILLEKIIIAGFPKIPTSLSEFPPSIVQSGEMSGRIETNTENGSKINLELFTAIARPGNSGGPVLSADGKLLGLVTLSLEKEIEAVDKGQHTLPCFAAVPASEIFKSFSELQVAREYTIPWEDYQ